VLLDLGPAGAVDGHTFHQLQAMQQQVQHAYT
jgi:hypothetical protein